MKKKQLALLIGGIVILNLVYVMVPKAEAEFLERPAAGELNLPAEAEPASLPLEEPPPLVAVDIKGEVREPGIFFVEEGMRVHDVVELAGGLSDQAQAGAVNFARRVFDEMVILVPALDDEGAAQIFWEEEAFQDPGQGGRVSLSQAPASELESLPGIGPARAQAIIDYRTKNGPFERVEDVMGVSGIGASVFENLKEQVEP